MVALKEFQVLEPDKLIEFDTHKKIRFMNTNTGMSFEFDYEGVEEKVRPYYLEQARKKKWKVLKATDSEIVLEKQRHENLLHLYLHKQKDSIWLLEASYRKIIK